MDVFEFPFALIAFLAFVMIMPAWTYFVGTHPAWSTLSPPGQFIAALSMPAAVTLALGSWLQ